MIFVCCQKNNSNFNSKNNSVFFDKNYSNSLSDKNRKKYLDSLTKLLNYSKNNDTIVRNLYLELATEYYYLNGIEESLSLSLHALKLSQIANDSLRKPKAMFYVGDCFRDKQKDSAYFYYLKAEKLYFKNHDLDNTARMLFNKAYVLFYDGNYVECEVQVSKALILLKSSNKYRLIYSCNTLLGNCLEKLTKYDEALKYHQIAKEYLSKMRIDYIDIDEINNYNVASVVNICNLYDLKGEYSKSIAELQNILKLDLKVKWPNLYAKVLSNLAYSKMKSGDYKNVQPMFFQSLKILDSLKIKSDILYVKINIGKFYLTQNDTLSSIKILKDAYALSKKIKNNNEVLSTLKLLSVIDEKNRLSHAYEYIKMSDSIYTLQKNAHNKYARIEYETSVLMSENEVLSNSKFYILVISLISIFLLMLFFVLRHLKYKNRELIFLKKQQKANEEIYHLLTQEHEKINLAKETEKAKIAKELHDGVMNKIYGVRMNLGFFNERSDVDIIQKRKEYIYELQNIENEIRTISHDLSQSSFFDEKDFNFLLLSLIENQVNFTDTSFKYEIDYSIDWTHIQNIYKVNIYRIAQESILNINKYANAQNCTIKIMLKAYDLLELEINDDGDGFDLKQNRKGIGLQNLEERVRSLKGNLKIESEKNNGTKISVNFNLPVLNHLKVSG